MTQPTEVSGTAMPGPGVGPLGLAIIPAVLVAPENAFRRLARDPQWIGPFVVSGAAGRDRRTGWRCPRRLEFSAQTAEATMARMWSVGGGSEARSDGPRCPAPTIAAPRFSCRTSVSLRSFRSSSGSWAP